MRANGLCQGYPPRWCSHVGGKRPELRFGSSVLTWKFAPPTALGGVALADISMTTRVVVLLHLIFTAAGLRLPETRDDVLGLRVLNCFLGEILCTVSEKECTWEMRFYSFLHIPMACAFQIADSKLAFRCQPRRSTELVSQTPCSEILKTGQVCQEKLAEWISFDFFTQPTGLAQQADFCRHVVVWARLLGCSQ